MKKTITYAVLIIAAVFLSNCKAKMKIAHKPYPHTRMDSVVDNYFGASVADPYRWLEDDNSTETALWVAAQNDATRDYLDRIPFRTQVLDRLTALWNYPKYDTPRRKGDYYYFFENDGLRNQSILYRVKELGSDPEVFLDPNKFSDGGTAALGTTSFSKDNSLMAYSVAQSGSDWVEIRVMETAQGRQLPDVIKWVKFSGAEWSGDGFYYSRYDEPSKEGALSALNSNQKIYYHKLGTSQDQDRLIYEDPEHPLRYISASVSRDDRELFVNVTEGTSGIEVLYKKDGRFETLFKGFDSDYDLVWAKDDKAIFHTNDMAPNYRLLEASFSTSGVEVKELVAEGGSMMQGATVSGGRLIVFYLENASSVAREYDLNGKFVRDIELPGIGSVGGFRADEEETETFYSFSGFTSPADIYRYDLVSGVSELYRRAEVSFDPDDYITKQVFYPSKDGTMVPMFITHRKGLKYNGKNPLYLYGYGGFNISLTPGFSPMAMALMEQGGIYVMVNLRGGGEFGESWHKAGMLSCKQNVFDDFIAAAEFLVKGGYTSPEKLAIAGGSNGGLLVGASVTQRPDLFAVALPAVGVMDMLRYHKFTVGWGWAVEYGCSDREEDFSYLYKYSPLHNIRQGVCYPATLVTTADHDDRVVPAHSFKFAAALQTAQGCDNPVLIRIDTNAGHGAGKPTSKKIEEAADVLSFMLWNTGVREIDPVGNF